MHNGMRLNVATMSCALLIYIAAHSVPAAAQTSTVDLAIDDPRPVSRAIDELIKYGAYPISYEDPQFKYSEDFRDVTNEIGTPRSGGKRVLVPVGGTLDIRQLPVPAKDNQPRLSADERRAIAEQALRKILEAQSTRTGGGRFALEQTGQMLHVVPALIQDGKGDWVQQASILNHRISIPAAERTAVEMLNEICAAVTKASGVGVAFGSGPLRTLYAHKSVQEANNESARDVLVRTLTEAGGFMTWKLWYGPDTRYYALNIVSLPRPEEKIKTTETPPASPSKKPTRNR